MCLGKHNEIIVWQKPWCQLKVTLVCFNVASVRFRESSSTGVLIGKMWCTVPPKTKVSAFREIRMGQVRGKPGRSENERNILCYRCEKKRQS